MMMTVVWLQPHDFSVLSLSFLVCSCFSSFSSYRCSSVCACVFLCGCLMHSSTLSFLSYFSSVFFSGACTIDSDKNQKRKPIVFFFLHLYSLFHSCSLCIQQTHIHTHKPKINRCLSVVKTEPPIGQWQTDRKQYCCPSRERRAYSEREKKEALFVQLNLNNQERIVFSIDCRV